MRKIGFGSILFMVLFLAGCKGVPSQATLQIHELSDKELLTEHFQEETDTPEASIGYTSCYWNWASRALPDLSITFHDALDEKGLNVTAANASEYGENCIDPATNQIAYFAAMETDWYVTVEVPSLGDKEQIGNTIREIIEVIVLLQTRTSAPNPGYVGITVTCEGQVDSMWFQLPAALDAIDQGLTGQAFYEALSP
jgi:hypothetical protein